MLFLAVFIGYIYAMFSNPGVIVRDMDKEKQGCIDDIEAGFSLNICPTCHIQKPMRSKHCTSWDRCVARFDHFCPWINNSIGVDNHTFFLYWLMATILLGIWFLSYGGRALRGPSDYPFFVLLFLELSTSILEILLFWIFFQQILGILKNQTSNETINKHFIHDGQVHNPFDAGKYNNLKQFFCESGEGWKKWIRLNAV